MALLDESERFIRRPFKGDLYMSVSPLALSIVEAARIGGIGRTSLYAEIASGRLRAIKRGKRTLILAEDLRAWLQSLPVATVGNPS